MTFDPERDFARFRVSGFVGDGRGWRVLDRMTDEVVAEFQTGNGQRTAHRDAQARAAELNLEHYRKVTA